MQPIYGNHNIYALIGWWKDFSHFKYNKELFIDVFESLSTDLARLASTPSLLECYRVLHLEYQNVMHGFSPFNEETVNKIRKLIIFGITIHPKFNELPFDDVL